MSGFHASCSRGLEYLLADELVALGCARATAAASGVNAQGQLHDAQRAVLWSRLASRVLWPLARFECADEAALYAGVAGIDWTQHLPEGCSIAVDAHVSGTGITHARFAAQRVKDAVVDTLRAQAGWRPDVDLDTPQVRLHLVVRKGVAVVSVDLGGGPLHRRGWRQAQGEAPLKETVAAAVLLRGSWPQTYADGGALLDPMCGSGTLLIEGALMAADVAPGLRRYGDALPTRWRGFDAQAWAALRGDAQTRAEAGLRDLRPCIHGRDLDPHAIRAARENAHAAGVMDAITLEAGDVRALVTPVDRLGRAGAHPAVEAGSIEELDSRLRGSDGSIGTVVCNPPYDARLAADPALYRALGDALKRAVPQWKAALLCGDAELARATGLRARKVYPVFNGPLECALLVCDPIALPTRADAAPRVLPEGAQMVANRLRKNLDKLKRWRQAEGVSCYRAYDADIPEYSAAVDVYETLEGQTWLHVAEYAAPADIPEALTRQRLNALLAACREVFALPKERIAVKTRSIGKGGSKYGHFDQRGELLTVREGQARVRVNLFDYLDTGLFLDHRPLRQRIFEEAQDVRFLNLFCYTGVATVQAALGGARQTTSVDLSATYLDWLSDNLRENGIGGTRHRLVQADALRWIEADQGHYDLVFCDPPTFSNSKRAADFDVQRDHVRLLRAVVARLTREGVCYFSNNFRRFRLDAEALADVATVEDISASTIAPDFARNPRIHRTWMIRPR